MATTRTPGAETVPLAVLRAQNGDVGAFEAVYRDHVVRVYNLVRRISGDPVVADELTQEVFVRAWQHLASFRGEASFATWLHRLAVNVALGDRRAEGRRLARILPLPDADAPAPQRAPDHAMDLARALDTLPPKARQVFVLHDVEGWPHEEIAQAMNTTVGTSKAQLHRARSLLRGALT
jgi:RNA polymerase sigma-70 factor (ECF subfamily)